MNEGGKKRWDLDERLLEYAAQIVRMADCLSNSPIGKHVQGQVVRSGTAPMAHHGEAGAAESRKDFIHKMKLGLKELRETDRWLKLIQRVPLVQEFDSVNALLQETDELIRIFVTSVNTAKDNLNNS